MAFSGYLQWMSTKTFSFLDWGKTISRQRRARLRPRKGPPFPCAHVRAGEIHLIPTECATMCARQGRVKST